MQAKLIMLAVGAAIVIGVFLAGRGYEKSSSTKKADEQEKQELVAIGEIKAGDVVHEAIVKKQIERVDQTPDPTGCLGADMPDPIIDDLGGLRKSTKANP